jgi:hypothetical protein
MEKEIGWFDLVEKNYQNWCQSVLLNERSVVEMYLTFYITCKNILGLRDFFVFSLILCFWTNYKVFLVEELVSCGY